MPDLGKAYVQIVPSAEGIKSQLENVLGKELGPAGDEAGKTLGARLTTKLKSVITVAAIGKAIQASLLEGANLQQSLGGVETLFKDSADKVVANAEKAYKTAGMSANQYMETVTGFSASLLQGLSGDTEKAAEIADMALIDMADNANKMGTSMELIQNAYQGFAKQNYTMLDNLKLGYGGTQTEMERLLADAQELTGIKYDISNLSDVYNAIHVIQEEMGITGTTAKEAAETFSGSFASMKAAAKNLLGNLALGKNVEKSLKELGNTVYTFVVKNLIPMVWNIISSLMKAILTTDWIEVAKNLIERLREDIEAAAGDILAADESIIDAVIESIDKKLPEVLEQGVETILALVDGILEGLPELISLAGEIVSKFAGCLVENLPQIVMAGVKLIAGLVKGIFQSLSEITYAALEVVGQFLKSILEPVGDIADAGVQWIENLLKGILSGVGKLIQNIVQIVKDIVAKFKGEDWNSVGYAITSGVAAGIKSGTSLLGNTAKTVAQSAIDAMKKKIESNSPSKVSKREVGLPIVEGVAYGMDENLDIIKKSMGNIRDTMFSTNDMKNAAYLAGQNMVPGLGNLEAFSEARMMQSVYENLADYLERQHDAVREGIANIRMVPNEREMIRFLDGLGYIRG